MYNKHYHIDVECTFHKKLLRDTNIDIISYIISQIKRVRLFEKCNVYVFQSGGSKNDTLPEMEKSTWHSLSFYLDAVWILLFGEFKTYLIN